MKNIYFILILFFSTNIYIQSNEIIVITWINYGTYFRIVATEGKDFTVDWGDGSEIETYTGLGIEQLISHIYENNDYDLEYQATIKAIDTDCFFTFFKSSRPNRTSPSGLKKLDLSSCPNLEILDCSYAWLNNLDLTENTKLKILSCGNNPILKSVNLSSNILLEEFGIGSDSLTNLDISKNYNLKILGINSSLMPHNHLVPIKNLNVSENIKLVELYLSNTQIKNIELNNNIELEILRCYDNSLISLDVSSNTKLKYFLCNNNQLKSLYLNEFACDSTPLPFMLTCDNNKLPLSELFNASEMVIGTNKRLGTQRLEPQNVPVGFTVDFSSQSEFKDITTVFVINKDGLPSEINNDYTITNGIITFLQDGIFTVTMTNAAIVSNYLYPAKVIAEFKVGYANIDDVSYLSDIVFYPNPVNDILYIKTEKETIPEVKLFSLEGQLLLNIKGNEIDVSGFAAGIYMLEVDGKKGKVVKN